MEMSKDEDPQDDILPESNKITQLLTETQKSQTMATPRTATVESRSYSFEKELLESQMHKMQLENSTLKTENKLLKDKYNRATARISELESHLSSMREELGGLQDNLDTEVIRAGRQARAEADRELQHSQSKMAALMHENEKHQAEIRNLQQKLESAVKEAELLKRSIDSSKAIEAHKQETGMMKTEIAKLRELLAASEKQLDEECHKRMELSQQVSKLTEMRELFQLQMDTAGYIGSAAEKKITALEQRLHVTEERLTQERADRASNLSQVEEKLLSDNAKLQALEKELRRQLQREKDKNRNLEHRAHEYREENLKLRLAVPDDDENIASYKSYDIPNNAHSSSRQQTKRVEDIKYILKELEKEGVEGGEAAALVALWNRTQQQQQEIKEWRVYLTDLTLPQDNTSEGLKMLREKLIEYEKQFREIEEKLGDIQAEKMTIDSTYKQQLLSLVKERHEASARLRTLEDLMDALRRENEVLRQGLASSAPTQGDPKMIVSSGAQLEAVVAENQALELRVSQLIRNSRSLEAEVDTLRAQVSARDIALEELSTELKTAHAQKSQTEDSAILKQKIEDLNVEMEQMQREMKTVAQQAEIAQKEKTHLQEELEEMDKQYQVAKARLTKHRAQREEDRDPKVAVLESELEEKDTQLLTLTSQLRQMEDKLETTQQQLTLQKDANSLLHMQVKELEAVLQQRGEMLETLAQKRSDLFEQLTLVKSHLNATTLALHQKQSQIQVLQKELAQEKDRATSLSDQIAQTQKTDLGKADLGLPESVLEVKLQEREDEIAILKGKLQNIVQELASKQDECDVAYQETMKLNEEIVAAKALTCRFNSEEALLRQELETGLQNYECQTQELRKCEEDLIKMEFRLQEVLCRFEAEACSQQALIIPQQTELTSDDIPKIYSELHNLRLLTEEKSKEVNMLQDKISRQQLQLCNQEKHLQTLQSIQTRTKEDVRHLSEALSLKIKEYAVTADINCTLAKEHSSLQKENQRLLKEIDEETAYKEKHRAEISEIIKKVEKHETKHLEATQVVQQKDSLIAELEAEIRQVKRSLTQVEVENEQLKTKVDLLNEDIRNLGNVNTTLEKRLEIERTSLSEERANASKRREDMAAANQRLEDLKLEQNTLQGSLGAERRNAQKLKDEIENHKEEEKKLQKQINTLTSEIETQHGQLLAVRQQLEQARQDKEAVYRDYQEVCRQLGEKDHLLTECQRKADRDVEAAHMEVARLMASHEQEKERMELDLMKVREELNDVRDQLKQKDLQLVSFGRTLQDLEDATREKRDFEMKAERLAITLDESRLHLESVNREMTSLRDINTQLQDNLSRSQANEINLQEQIRLIQGSADSQATELRHMMEGMKAHHEFEKKSLKDALSHMEAQLKITEGDLRVALENQEQLKGEKHCLEHTLNSTKTQVTEQSTALQVSQEKLSVLKVQMNDAEKSKFSSEKQVVELQESITRLETEILSKGEHIRTLTCDLQEAEGAVEAKNSELQGKQEQIDILKEEVSKLQQALESQQHQLASRMRKSTTELKHQLENLEAERIKLAQQAHLMSVDLEQAREQIIIKNKENLKLQEDKVSLECQVQEYVTKLHSTQVSLSQEEELQTKLSSRKEMSLVMQDFSKQLLKQMEDARTTQGQERDTKQVQKLKQDLRSLETQLNAEKALHSITKNALQNLEEDCARLRQQIHAMRRKGYAHEKKHKSRMEEINEIIARSQTRAQVMMAAGVYTDGTFRNMNPSRDFNVSAAANASGDISPDTSLALSESSFTTGAFLNNSFLNLSGTLFPGASLSK